GPLDVDSHDPRMRVGRAEEGHVGAPRRPDVVHVAPRPRQEPTVFPSLERPADPPPVLGVDHQKTARGLAGEPVPPTTLSGAMTSMNSSRPSSRHARASGSRSALSRRATP